MRKQSHLLYIMKGTEVPNPRRSSACDCTCVLTRNRSLSRDSLILACHAHSVLFLPVQSSLTSFWRSLKGLCNFSFPSWFHTDSTPFMRFIAFSRKLHSAFRLDQKTWSQHSHVFRLTDTAALNCGHTFVGGYLLSYSQWPIIKLTKNVSPSLA